MGDDLRDVPSRGDQAVDRAEYVRLSWEGAKARLAQDAKYAGSDTYAQVYASDIRSALERVEELTEKLNCMMSVTSLTRRTQAAEKRAEHLEAGYHRRKEELDEQYREILALRQRVEELEREKEAADAIRRDFNRCYDIAMLASSYWPELPGSFGGTVSERLKVTFTATHQAWEAAEAEGERLRAALGWIMDHEDSGLKLAYTTCDVGDSTNADRGCVWCIARAVLAPEVK